LKISGDDVGFDDGQQTVRVDLQDSVETLQ